MGWHRELLIGFDLGTTGTGPHGARIVTGTVIEVRAGEAAGRREWPADPGVPVPADAAAVHGVGNERATAEGRPAAQAADANAAPWGAGAPVVAYDAAFHPRASGASRMSHPAAACQVPACAGVEAA